jgi:hypothetical protein
MRCLMCESELIEPRRTDYTITDPTTNTISGVCGRCFVLVSILDELRDINGELKKWQNLKTSTTIQ